MTPFARRRDRDAYATIRGFVYQADLTILRWLDLRTGQALELESGEDIDLVADALKTDPFPIDRLLEQVKHLKSNLTMRSVVVLEAMANAIRHRNENVGHKLVIRFSTNARIGREQGLPAGTPAGIGLLELWEKLRKGEDCGIPRADGYRLIKTFVLAIRKPKNFNRKAWRQLNDFFRTADETAIDDLILHVEWATGGFSGERMQPQIEARLLALGKAVDAAQASQQYERLFLHLFKLLCQSGRKTLTPEDLAHHLSLPTLSATDHAILLQVNDRLRLVELRLCSVEQLVYTLDRTVADLTARKVHTRATSKRCFQLPAFCTDFTGRHVEIQRISERLLGESGKAGLAVRGMGGVGKTTLAVRVAHQIKDQFADAQLFIDLKGTTKPLTPTDVMTRIIRDFHPELEKVPDDGHSLVSLYRTALHGKRALILLDNAYDEAQVRPLLSVPPPVRFIITSRNALGLDDVESVPLDLFSPKEAEAFLRSIVGEKGTAEELDAVANLCGWLPLALRVAGDFLRLHDNWSVKHYTEALGKERLKWLKGKTADRDVEAVLRLSAAMLVEDSVELAKRWQMLSVLPGDFFQLAASALWQLNLEAAREELTKLLDHGLVDYDKETERYYLHELMRPIAQDPFEGASYHPGQGESAERIRTAERRFSLHYCRVLGIAERAYLQGKDGVLHGLAIYDLEEENIRQGWDWANLHRSEDRLATELSREYADSSAHIANLRITARDLVGLLTNAIEACRELGDRSGESRAHGNLGRAYLSAGEARNAVQAHEQQLVIARELDDQEGEGVALGNLGVAYRQLCEFPKAIECHKQQLEITRKAGNRRGEGIALGSLGNVYSALGDDKKAVFYWERHVEMAREIGDPHSESVELGNLGIAYRRLREYRKSTEYHARHLTMARQLRDRRGEGRALGNVGLVYLDTGYPKQAVSYFEQDLAISRETGDRRSEASSLGNLGIAHHRMGDSNTAIEYFQRQLVIARDVGDRRGEGNALGCLGAVAGDIGDTKHAIAYFEQSLEISREIGDQHGEGNSCFSIAIALGRSSQRDSAVQFARQALTIFEAIESPMANDVRVFLEKCDEDVSS